MDSEDGWALVAGAAGRPEAVHDRDLALRTAVRLGMTVAPGVVGCSVTHCADDGYRTSLSATDLATATDLAQYDAGAGPCLTAASEGRRRQLDAADKESDYPEFAVAAARHGVRSSLSLPLAGGLPAALNLYASTPATFDSERARNVAQLLAQCMTASLRTDLAESIASGGSAGAPVAPADLAAALTRSRLIRDAESALMVDDQLSRTEAFGVLSRRSRAERRCVFDVAVEVLRRVDREPGR